MSNLENAKAIDQLKLALPIATSNFNDFLLWCSQHNIIGSVTLNHCNGGFITLMEVDIAGHVKSTINFGDAKSPCKTFEEAFNKLQTIYEGKTICHT